MEKICWANTDDFEKSEFVIIGIPDESHSHSLRKGTGEAPSRIRKISTIRDSYRRDGIVSLGRPFQGSEKRVHDYGDINRSQIESVYEKIFSSAKVPISIGGDHSISSLIIKALAKNYEKISLVYLDAHPDFVSSYDNYYGSVVNDVVSHIDVPSSVQIGIRTPEKEEIDNISKFDLKVVTPFEIKERGIKQITDSIIKRLGSNVYVSLDMDCIDPSFAPGVSVPVPMGLDSTDVAYMLREIARRGIIGMDVMEVCPSFDVKDRTSHLASRLIAEVLYLTGEEHGI